MPTAPVDGGPFEELSLDLLWDAEKLLAFVSERWQLVVLVWLAVNCGVGLLLAQLHLWRKSGARGGKIA